MTEKLQNHLLAAKTVINGKEYLEYDFAIAVIKKITTRAQPTPEQKESYDKYVAFLNKTFGKKYREKKSLTNFAARLNDGWTGVEFKQAIENAKKDSYHTENNFKHLTPAFFCREGMLDKWFNATTKDKEKIKSSLSFQ